MAGIATVSPTRNISTTMSATVFRWAVSAPPRRWPMSSQGAHGAFAIKAVADPQPGVSTIAAAPDALSKGAYTDRGILRHGLSPSVTTLTEKPPGPFAPPRQSAQRGSPQGWWRGTF